MREGLLARHTLCFATNAHCPCISMIIIKIGKKADPVII